MNCDKYINTLEYPVKKEHETKRWFFGENCVAEQVNSEKIKFITSGINVTDLKGLKTKQIYSDEYYQLANKFNTENARIEEEFRKDLFNDLGITNNPKRDLLYAKAYERGHSSGYSEIADIAEDLVQLIY
jgi:hypothetical protein